MRTDKRGKIINLSSFSMRREESKGAQKAVSKPEEAFLYTMDLLMEDFGKKHVAEHCVLCEPMKVLGLHRDEVMVDLTVSLFTTFFPSFEGYVLEMRESLIKNLLDRRDKRNYPSWQEKIKSLLLEQVRVDLGDFLGDIQKHLAKYTGYPVDSPRYDEILSRALETIQKEWIGKK